MSWRWLAALFILVGCHREAVGPLPQRAYVWQREWTPAVRDAAQQADASSLRGLVLFGAEIAWDQGKPRVFRGSINWEAVRRLHKPVGLALRVAPFSGPFAADDAAGKAICDTARSLLDTMKAERVACAEFHLDFDCAQKKLAGYATWVRAVKEVVTPTRILITTLPAWLAEPEFAKLIQIPDSYVLQVHSVPPSRPAARASVCEPDRARAWVAKAATLGRPFIVALSTYSVTVGYDVAGKMRGMAMDAVQPAWPAGTRLMQLDSNAEAMSALVNEWRERRPSAMQGVIWYRLPVATDQRNWRPATFVAVVEGRPLRHHLTARVTEATPTDLSLVNDGNVDEDFAGRVIIRWEGEVPQASDALPGWSLRLEDHQAEFTREQPLRLPPGTSRSIGWLRFHQRASLHVEVSP